MEAVLLLIDMLLMLYLCWRLFRCDPSRLQEISLGFLDYKREDPRV